VTFRYRCPPGPSSTTAWLKNADCVITKVSYTYTMFFLRQEQNLRDHERRRRVGGA